MIGVLIANVLKKIVELIKFNDTILELGSGKSSELLNKFYNVISVEDNKEWMNKYNTQYIHVNTVGKGEYDFKELSKKIKDIDYKLLIIDGPNDNREEIVNHINIFKNDVPVIWDDTQVYEKYAIQMSEQTNKSYTTYQCKPQPPWYWANHMINGEKCGGKRFTLII
tara:strand:+ start:664 stop:1164 length:501 start_codon:yes stop_codon:yes gene_type:complete